MLDRILDLMEKRGVSAKELTTRTGLNNSAITNWKNGQGKPSTDAIVKLADYFDVSADFILGRERREKKQQPLDKVLAHHALGACFASPAFYESQGIPVEAPRHSINWPKAKKTIENKSDGKLTHDRLNSFLMIATSYTSFDDDEYPTLDEYVLLRSLAGKIERFDAMGGVPRDELADEFLRHLTTVHEAAKNSDNIRVAAALDEIASELT